MLESTLGMLSSDKLLCVVVADDVSTELSLKFDTDSQAHNAETITAAKNNKKLLFIDCPLCYALV